MLLLILQSLYQLNASNVKLADFSVTKEKLVFSDLRGPESLIWCRLAGTHLNGCPSSDFWMACRMPLYILKQMVTDSRAKPM